MAQEISIVPESDGNCASEWFATVRLADFSENTRFQTLVRMRSLKNGGNGMSASEVGRLSQKKTRIR